MVTITEEVKVIRVGNSLRIAIQNVFCKALGIEEGTLCGSAQLTVIFWSALFNAGTHERGPSLPLFHKSKRFAIRFR